MIRVDAEIVINCPVEEVFAFLTDHRNDIQWQEGLLEVRVRPDGSAGVGTQITTVRKFLSRRAESTIEISEFIPHQKEAFRTVTGPLEVCGWTLYEGRDGTTRVTKHIGMHTGSFFAFADSLVTGSLQRNMVAGLSDAKDLLESRIGPSSKSGG